MLFRIAILLIASCAGLAVGLAGFGTYGAVAGGLLGALLWLAWDTWRAVHFLAWLRNPDLSQAGSRVGFWGELAYRVTRLVRLQSQQTQEAELRLQEFLAAIQASPNGVVLLDAQSRISWCNETAAQHFGFDAQRDLQQHIGNLVREPEFANYLAEADFTHEVMMPGRGRSGARPVRLSVQLHPYGSGRTLLLSHDVTALEQADIMRRDFVANVSHEMRTPLTVLYGFVETLQTLDLSDAQRNQYLDLMGQQARRMQSLVSDLLTLSKLESSAHPPEQSWLGVQALLNHCKQEAIGLSAGRHTMHFGSDTQCELQGASTQLLSAMSNLVGNAVGYTPEGGRLDVRWRVLSDGRGEFTVRDTGPGIAPEHIPRLTERFYRVDRSRSRQTGGTGLGLAIVKHVAQRHGAELRIESVVGVGSAFTMVFPASRVRAVQSG